MTDVKGQICVLFKNKIDSYLRNAFEGSKAECFSYELECEGSFYNLQLREELEEINLVRWYEGISYYDSSKARMLTEGYSDDDIYALETFLSRMAYFFCIDFNMRNKELNLIYLMHQQIFYNSNTPLNEPLNIYSDNSSTSNGINTQTDILHSLLCELFLNYELFSKFSIDSDSLWFETDNNGLIRFSEMVSNFHRDSSETDSRLKLFQLAVIEEFIESASRSEKFTSINLSQRFKCDLIDPNYFIESYENDSHEVFSKMIDLYDNAKGIDGDLVKCFLINNFMFFILRRRAVDILKLKNYIGDDNKFAGIVKFMLGRGLMFPRRILLGLGIDDIVNKIE